MIHLPIKISLLLFSIYSSFGCFPEIGFSNLKSKYILVEKIGFCNTKEPPKVKDWKKCRT